MLIEVKAKVARIIDAKTRKRTETYLLDKEFFSEAEYIVTAYLNTQVAEGTVEGFEIQSLKLSQIKEVASQFDGENSFIATLIDIWLDDDGTEKKLKYKVLLWADTPSQAMSNILQLAREGYDMQIEGIKQVDYEYLVGTSETTNTEEEPQDEQD